MFVNLLDTHRGLQDEMAYPTNYMDSRDRIILTEVRIILAECDKVTGKQQVIALDNAVFWKPGELKKSGKA